jgi:hypothetical protein
MRLKGIFFIFIAAILCGGFSCNRTGQDFLSSIDPGSYDGTWWNRTPVRLIQTNFPQIHASMDVDDYVQTLIDASASAVMFNTGGIVASYQTRLPYHNKNPYMGERDFIRELITKAHENDIRYIARFDFSRIHPRIAGQKPEWLYVGTDGKNLVFNGKVSTCLNGGYYQEYAFEILKEVIANYPIDGIFFNMMGYAGATYAGVSHGICQCENCKKRFLDSTGLKLPVNDNDPGINEYRRFQRETSFELYTRVTDFIKQQDPGLVIYNYNDVGTSWIASESGGTMLRTGPENIYNATSRVKHTLGSYKDRTQLNLIMGFQAIGYRSVMNNPNLLRGWMLQNMLHGAPVGFVVVGTLVHYEDRGFIKTVNDLYGFHKTHEKLFTNVRSVSSVALVQGRWGSEAQGILNILSEEHIMYDIINPEQFGTERTPRQIEDYDVIILNNITGLDDDLIARLDDFVHNGGKLLVTGATSTRDGNGRPVNRIRLRSLGVEPEYELFPQAQATYLKISEDDGETLGQFRDFTLMMMNTDFLKCRVREGARGYMRLLPTNMYGPSEVTWYTEDEITGYPGVVAYEYGKGKTVFIPWLISGEYERHGNPSHRSLFLGALNNLLRAESSLATDASPVVEMTHLANLNGQFEWVGMINHSGYMGASVREPVTIHNTTIHLRPVRPVKEVRLLRSGAKLGFKQLDDGWIECVVPRLEDFEMLLCLYR